MLPRVSAGGQVLVPILDPTHRLPGLQRQPSDEDLLRQQNRLVAEPAANIGRDDADLHFRDLQCLSKAATHDVRKLRSTVNY